MRTVLCEGKPGDALQENPFLENDRVYVPVFTLLREGKGKGPWVPTPMDGAYRETSQQRRNVGEPENVYRVGHGPASWLGGGAGQGGANQGIKTRGTSARGAEPNHGSQVRTRANLGSA